MTQHIPKIQRMEVYPGMTKAEWKTYQHWRKVGPDLLAALQRSEQYLHIAIQDGIEREPKLSESTLDIARRDLEMVQTAIAKAKGE